MINFEMPKEEPSIIKVIGVGGGGGNAVNHMFRQGIKGVDFIVCNTDQQALNYSPVPLKVSLGASLTEGRGAGAQPEVGKNAALENLEEIKSLLGMDTKMVFITAGMGGGTGTGAAPVIARAAKEMGILTVGIVTIPFSFEGKRRRMQAEEGLELLKQNVDTLLIINNDKLREIYGNKKITEAFAHADEVLATAAKSIAEIITVALHINTDFADIQTVMKDSGVALMGSASMAGEDRAVKAVQQALSSPLLNDNRIEGARYVLLNITCSSDHELTMDELCGITDYIQEESGMSAEMIKGFGIDDTLGEEVRVTIIATGFTPNATNFSAGPVAVSRKVHVLEAAKAEVATLPEMPAPAAILPTAIVDEQKLLDEPYLKISEPVKVEEVPVAIVETPPASVAPVVEETTAEAPAAEVPAPDKIVHLLTEESVAKEAEISASLAAEAEQDEQARRNRERVERLKSFSFRYKNGNNNLNEMENVPAYKRRNIELNDVPHSSESSLSRYTLSDGEENKAEIKPNNSFLHDNVD